jgi:hypothetical protein
MGRQTIHSICLHRIISRGTCVIWYLPPHHVPHKPLTRCAYSARENAEQARDAVEADALTDLKPRTLVTHVEEEVDGHY